MGGGWIKLGQAHVGAHPEGAVIMLKDSIDDVVGQSFPGSIHFIFCGFRIKFNHTAAGGAQPKYPGLVFHDGKKGIGLHRIVIPVKEPVELLRFLVVPVQSLVGAHPQVIASVNIQGGDNVVCQGFIIRFRMGVNGE